MTLGDALMSSPEPESGSFLLFSQALFPLLPSVQIPFAAFCSPDPDILSQESRDVQVLAIDDRGFAFLKATARNWLELQCFLFRFDLFRGRWRLRLRVRFGDRANLRGLVRFGFSARKHQFFGGTLRCAFSRNRLFLRSRLPEGIRALPQASKAPA